MKPGDRRTVAVSSLSPRGEGVADVDGLELRVYGAYPGETVEARIDAISRHHARAFATLLEVKTPHAERAPAACARHTERAGKCTGCPLMSLGLPAQREAKLARARALGLPVVAPMRGAEGLGYRCSSKRVAGGRPGALILGSYVRGTHHVADMRRCQVDHPRIAAVADEIARVASELRVEPFEGTRGDLRYVWLKTDGERVLATLVSAAPESRVPEIAERVAPPTAVAWSVQPAAGNTLRGEPPRPLRGEPALEVELGGVRTVVGPLGFLQPNPAMAAAAYDALVSHADGAPSGGAVAFDLYAGAGVTTAMLRARFGEVTPCESYPESALALGVEPEDVLEFLRRQAGRTVDLVVANPPRSGFGEGVCDALAALAPARLHIMSCDAETLARDLQALASRFRVESVVTYDTLPHTAHFELVAHLVAR